MLSSDEFEKIISRPESSILDFKETMYIFSDDTEFKNTAKFVKDIISFTNTVRNETAYIVIGIKEEVNGNKQIQGINSYVDDAILQDKIKDKVFPRPKFLFYTYNYNLLKFGIFEFPIAKYSVPISPTVKMKGLEIGKIYYRQGTSNSEASGQETIRIYNWLQSLPEIKQGVTKQDMVAKLIKELTSGSEKLSTIISELWNITQRYNSEDLLRFCSDELQGLNSDYVGKNQKEYSYRVQTLFVSPVTIEINPFSNVTSNSIKAEFRRSDNFFERDVLMSQTITKVEEILQRFKENPNNTIATITMKSKDLFAESSKGNYPVYAYIFVDDIISLYTNIRQKTIDKLMKF